MCSSPYIGFQRYVKGGKVENLYNLFTKNEIDYMLFYQKKYPFDPLPVEFFQKRSLDTVLWKIVSMPCRRCLECRLKYSKEWAVRCILEASLHEKNCFVTLTYSPENLPKNGSLVKEHVQKFMKRLRFKYGKGIRYFYCGEYGSLRGRPHYHLLLFNFDFPDKRPFFKSGSNVVFRSDSLERLWLYGLSSTGDLTFYSAAYVARYILKKEYGKFTDYVIKDILPEYTNMSLKPAIALDWFNKYYEDIYNHDFIQVTRDIKCKPPAYFDKKFQEIDPFLMEQKKKERIIRSCELYFDKPEEFLPERIADKSKYLEVVTAQLPRNYESEGIL